MLAGEVNFFDTTIETPHEDVSWRQIMALLTVRYHFVEDHRIVQHVVPSRFPFTSADAQLYKNKCRKINSDIQQSLLQNIQNGLDMLVLSMDRVRFAIQSTRGS